MSERLFLRLDGDTCHGPESGTPPGTVRCVEVRAPLRAYVADVLVCREAIPPGAEVLERVIPDGAVHLVFNLGDAPSAGEAPGFAAEAIGASVEPALVRLRGRIDGVSVTLRAGAAAAILGVPAGELAGTTVPLDALWRGEARRVLERMAAARDDAARVAALQDALLTQVRCRDASPPAGASRAARLIAESGGARALREVAAAVGVGERRLQQLFHAHVGLSPRAWSRLARLRACLRMLRARPAPAWASVAVEAGFYDQAHLANEFRALCGLSPTEFLGRAASGSSKTAG